MTVRFIHVSAPNKPGILGELAGALSDAGVNIEAFTADESGLRFLTDDPDKAAEALATTGHDIDVHELVAVQVPDKPGTLAALGKALGSAGINIVSTFGANSESAGSIYLDVADADKAWDALEGIVEPDD